MWNDAKTLLNRGFFLQRQREKECVQTKKWRYSECDIIEGDLIEGFHCYAAKPAEICRAKKKQEKSSKELQL